MSEVVARAERREEALRDAADDLVPFSLRRDVPSRPRCVGSPLGFGDLPPVALDFDFGFDLDFGFGLVPNP